MDDSRFDGWTRRRFGLATGGLFAALFGVTTTERTAAKHHRHHKPKRCTKTETTCGKKCVKGICCPGTDCSPDCECRRAVEGDTFCFFTNSLVSCEQCESSTDCPDGQRCAKSSLCVGSTALCLPECVN
jgi:hypothetical protein